MDRLRRLATRISGSNFAVFFLLLLAGLIAYYPALNGDFLWDDTYLVGQNPFYKSPVFILEVFKHYLYLDSASVYYRPVQNISYMFDYWLWTHNPFGYHLSNVFYHILTAFLLFLLLKAVLPTLARTGSPGDSTVYNPVALLVSLVWVAHPIHNAAVAYVAGRADSIACCFAIAAWLLYLKSVRSRTTVVKWGLPVLALFFCFIGLCAKEIAFIWMALFVFHLFFFCPETPLRKKFAILAGIVAVLGIYAYVRTRPGGGAPLGGPDVPAYSMRFMLMLRALGDYTWLVFFPDVLHMDRFVLTTALTASMPSWESNIRFEYLPLIGTLTILAFIFMGKSKLPGQRIRLFGIAWFLLGFLPISNLFPLNAQVAEHWIYMPSMGFLLFLAGCIVALPERYRTVAACVAALSVIPFTIRTAFRSYDWADNERFYTQTARAGGGTTRINLNLAIVYEGKKDYAKAEAILRDILKRFPDYAPAKLNLGVVLRAEGKNEEAEKTFTYDKAATELMANQYSHTWTAALSMAEMRFNEQKHDESLAILDEAIKRHPNVWDLTFRKVMELEKMGRKDDAEKTMKSYADAHWWHYDAHMMLAHLELVNSETDAAVATLRQAALLDIHASDPYNKIAHAYFNTGRIDDALRAQNKAVDREPRPSQYVFLAVILEKLDRKEEASAAIQKAEQMRESLSGTNAPGAAAPAP